MSEIGEIYAFPYYSASGIVTEDPSGPLVWYGIVVSVTDNAHEIIVNVCNNDKQPTGKYYMIDARIAVSVDADVEVIRTARLRTPKVSKRVGRNALFDYDNTYDHEYKAVDPIKNAVNKYLGELALKFKCKTALVLDFVGNDPLHNGSLATTKVLKENGVRHINVPNNAIDREMAARAASVVGVNVWPMKCNEFLMRPSDDKYSIMFLDFCGQLCTNKEDIQLALDRVYTGKRNRGAVFAVTLYVYRTRDQKKEHCEQFIQNEFEKRDLLYEPLCDGVQNGGVCTWFWILRKKTKCFEM
jgi:hypothetical protein